MRLLTSTLAISIAIAFGAAFARTPGQAPMVEATEAGTAYDFAFMSIDGSPMPLAAYRGKAILLVNTASLCGFTDQYAGLQQLHEAHANAGLVVVGAPSNDFGGQEPGSNDDIKKFCKVNFNVTFPLTEKVKVTGGGAHAFYAWARARLGPDQAPKWNFHKYLVGRDGALIAAFPSSVAPDDDALTSAIEAALAEPSA